MEELIKQLGINGIGFVFLYYFMNKTFNMQKDKDGKIEKVYEKIDNLVDAIQSSVTKDIQVSTRTEEHQKEIKDMYIRISRNIKDSDNITANEIEKLRTDIKALSLMVNELKVFVNYCPHIQKTIKEE